MRVRCHYLRYRRWKRYNKCFPILQMDKATNAGKIQSNILFYRPLFLPLKLHSRSHFIFSTSFILGSG